MTAEFGAFAQVDVPPVGVVSSPLVSAEQYDVGPRGESRATIAYTDDLIPAALASRADR